MMKIITKSIALLIILIIFSFIAFYISLIRGLELNNIYYKNISISKLYMKIDKKFIFKANNIKIITKNDNSKTNFREINKIMVEIFKYLKYFQEIEIKNFSINSKKIEIIDYKNRIIKYSSDSISIVAKITPTINKTIFNIKSINLKSQNKIIKNINGYYIPHFRYLDIYIKNLNLYNSKIDANIKLYEKKLTLSASILNLSSITPYVKYIPVEYKAYTNKILFKNIDIKDILLKLNLNNLKVTIKNIDLAIKNLSYEKHKIDNIKINIDKNFNIKAKIDNFNTIFQESNISLNNITILRNHNGNIDLKSTNLLYSKNNLNILFNPIKIKFNKNILNFKSNNMYLTQGAQNIKLNNISINGNINRVLNISGNNFNYKKGNLNFLVKNIDLEYNKIENNIFIKSINALYKTTFNPKNSLINLKNLNINLNNIITISFNTNSLLSKNILGLLKEFKVFIPIYQKSGKNNIFIKLSLGKKIDSFIKLDTNNSTLILSKELLLKIKSANLEMNNSIINLTNSEIEFNKSIANIDYFIKNGIIDLGKKTLKTEGKFKLLNLKNLMTIKNYPEDIKIDLNKTAINLKNLETTLSFNPLTIELNKISKFTQYYKLLKELKVSEGSAKIIIDKNISINAYVKDINQSIIIKNKKPIKNLFTNITITPNNKIIIKTDDIFATIKENNYSAKFKNIDFNISQILDTNKSNSSSENEKNKTEKKAIYAKIYGTNSSIIYHKISLYSNKIKLDLQDNNMTFSALNGENNISGKMVNGNVKIYGININEKTLKNITKKNPIKKILLNFMMIKYKDNPTIYGLVEIKRGYIKEMTLINNIVSFINTIPSLLTFSRTGYSNKGYRIKKGHIDFIKYQNYIYFKKIDIKGENMSFNGQGFIDLKANTIKMKLNVNIIIKLVKDIPLVGYILLGKDGGITIKINIDGDLSNPTISKNSLANIISSPFEILYRTITLPAHIFK